MTIRTVTVSGITEVDFNANGKSPYFFASEKYAWIKNNSDAAMYVSLDENCTAGAAGTAMISSGECGRIELSPENKLYISGSGSAEIRTGDTAECPFKVQSGGGEKLLRYLGVTTTALTDGATTNPITINGTSVTAREADWAIYGSSDYIFNGTAWQEVGDLSNYYTKSETDTLLSGKANSSDVYTKTQADNLFVMQEDIDIKETPTTAEINAAIADIWGA